MQTAVSRTKLNHLLHLVIRDYDTYGPIRKGGRKQLSFGKVNNPEDLALFENLPKSSFKKILFPNPMPLNQPSNSRKIAFIGLANCDIWALQYFLDQFDKSNLMPKREDILIVGAECIPQDSCFCVFTGTNKHGSFDLFLQKEPNEEVGIFSKGETGGKLIEQLGLKDKKGLKLRPIINNSSEICDFNRLAQVLDNKKNPLWLPLSNNCFGCGACSTACPLCFCFSQSFENDCDGKTVNCLKWDSCFNKNFSEIQHRFDFRPKIIDRFYNWYHHKFVRSMHKNKYPLCTGCGRCILACPANLNTRNILSAFLQKGNS